MARYYTPGLKEQRDWYAWVASRPAPVRALAEWIEPWTLYRLRSTGLRGIFSGFYPQGDDYKIALRFLPKYNPMLANTEMQAIVPIDDLEPCDLPGPGDRVGGYCLAQRADGWISEH